MLKEGDSVQEHVKAMTELFSELSVIGVKIDEEDRVVQLLASLPDIYNTLLLLPLRPILKYPIWRSLLKLRLTIL